MLLFFLLILHVSDVNSEVCAELSFASSHYKATFVKVTTPADYRTWSEIRGMCDEDYELVSITSAKENSVILDMLENCTDGGYAIGLSRDAGVERQFDSNWNWKSGEPAAGLFWYPGEPNVQNTYCAIAYILTTNTEPNTWGDEKCTDKLGTWIGSLGYGYICEKPIITTTQQTTEYYHSLITTEPDNQGEQISSEVATTIPTSVPVTVYNEENKPSSGVDILLIVASSSSVVVIIILIFLYRCRNQLCCKRRTETKPEYWVDKTMTSKVPIEPPVNEHNVVNYAYCIESSIELSKGNPSIRTQQDADQAKENNMNVEVKLSDDSGLPDTVTSVDDSGLPDTVTSSDDSGLPDTVTSSDDSGLPDDLTEENPNYDSYVKDDEMDLMYTTIPNIEMEGEVDNPAYAALPFEPDYDSVEKTDNVTQCIEMQNDYATVQYDENNQEVDRHTKADKKKRNGYEEVGALMKTGEMSKNDASLDKINPVAPNDAQENICSIDDGKLQCNDLYAKPDMTKKRKGQHSVSNTIPSKTKNSLRTTAVVMPTDNMDESVGKRKDGYEQVDLGDFIPETNSLLDKTTDANELNSDIDSLYAKPDMTKKRAQTSTRKTIDVDGNYTQTNENTNVFASGSESKIVSDSGTEKEMVDDGSMSRTDNRVSISLPTNTIDSADVPKEETSVC